MFYKIFDEPGDYLDQDGIEMNLVSCTKYLSADPNYSFGWTEFPDEFSAMEHFGLTKIPDFNEITKLLNE